MVNDDVLKINWGHLDVQMQIYAVGQTPPRGADKPLEVADGVIGFDVDPRGSWQDSGVDVTKGDAVVISTTDTYKFGANKSIDANGLVDKPDTEPATGTWPSPGLPGLALIGRLRGGDGKPFFVGEQHEFTASADGRLFLMVNDDRRSANKGVLHVRISVSGDR
jgi:hypothetical protein